MKRVAMLLLLGALGCDQAEVRTGARELTTLEPDAVRVLVSPTGIGQLVEVASPGGFPLKQAARRIVDPDLELSVGPLDQTLAVLSRSSVAQPGSAVLTTRLDGSAIFVPVRIVVGNETRVCRWRVEVDEVEAVASLVLVPGEEGAEFGVRDTPVVTLEQPSLVAVDDCADLEPLLPDDFEDLLVAYVDESLADAAATSLPSSPLDTLGVLLGNVRLTRTSAFENRTGTLVIEGAVSTREDGLAITSNGLSVSVDAAAEAERARCAPPSAISVDAGDGARAINPADLQRFNADFALAVSDNWIARIAQGATLSGFSCSGLEDARPARVNEEAVPLEDLLLAEINLDQVPVGTTAQLAIAPGTLPELEFLPNQGSIVLRFDDFQIEVYGEVFGARTRLARIVTDAEIGLSPTAQVVGVAKFDLDSIEVKTERIDSEFLVTTPEQDALDRWTRRTMLSLLEDSFEFPLPLSPAAPVRVLGVQVRENDLVALLRFE